MNELLFEWITDRWAGEADAGKDASFRGWTFFDTNCLSELVKLAAAGYQAQVSDLVRGRSLLIPSTVFQELRHAPEICREIPTALSAATLYLLSHTTAFWKCDLWNFFNVVGIRRNLLEVYQLKPEVFVELPQNRAFWEACNRSEARVRTQFASKIAPDLAADLDERLLHAHIWSRINDECKEVMDTELPVADARSSAFPAFFVYSYAYWYRYMRRSAARVEDNDFNDLAHVIAAPYCSEYFAERSFALLLREQVQGRAPPTPYRTAKLLHRRGMLDDQKLRQARHSMRKEQARLLMNTRIVTFAELRSAVAKGGVS